MKTDERRKKALENARKRGEAAKEWFKTNTLNNQTKPEFDRLMKSINKQ